MSRRKSEITGHMNERDFPVEQFHVRFCFPDAATADAFRERFSGTRLTYSSSKPGRALGPRWRHQRSYSPRKVVTPADLRRLHKPTLSKLR